jgi:hypothetical protein
VRVQYLLAAAAVLLVAAVMLAIEMEALGRRC